MATKTKVGATEPEPRPEPIPQNVICSICRLDWGEHGDAPNLMKCIELLRKELARRPRQSLTSITSPTPYITYTSSGGNPAG